MTAASRGNIRQRYIGISQCQQLLARVLLCELKTNSIPERLPTRDCCGEPGTVDLFYFYVLSLAVFLESKSLSLWLHVNLGPMSGPGDTGWLLGAAETSFGFH